jgi:CheY-like chemotaxis protein
LVEDDPATNRTLARLLARRGHSVQAAATGREALATPDLGGFDLVICDIGLPDINGWDLLVELKQRAPQLQAVALTGFGYIGDYEKSAEAGFAVHITKPAEIDAIERVMAQLFGDREPPAP